jgi:dipeptidyl aminopeptidase/acylaminoacyl peptidase
MYGSPCRQSLTSLIHQHACTHHARALSSLYVRLTLPTVTDLAYTPTCLQEPETIFESKHGLIRGYDFAPDGRSVAIANDRGDHGFVGVLPLDNGDASITWISPSVDTDTSPTWSPDGTHLAWRREATLIGRDGRDPRCTEGGYCGTAGPAYSIMVAKVSVSSVSRPVLGPALELHRDWTTGYPDGSAGYGSRPLVWMSNGSGVVFGCEADGYIKVCAARLGADGASGAITVTPKQCDHQAFSLRGDSLFTTNNCDMVDSLGIERVDMRTLEHTVVQPAKAHLVSGMSAAGAHLVEFSDGSLVYFQSTWNTSTSVVLLPGGVGSSAQGDSAVRVISVPDRNNALRLFSPPTLVTFPSPDGKFTLHAQVFEPPLLSSTEDRNASSAALTKRGRPGIVFTHGGCQRQMYAAVHYSLPYAQLYGLNQYLASTGAVVISVNYRGGPGYGVAFRAANRSGWQGASEYQDVRAAALYLQGRPDVGSIGIYGLSYGGLNAMQASVFFLFP